MQNSVDHIICTGLSKSFGGITALDDVSVVFARGQCHALMGENGAGKSTLCKIFAGSLRPDRGTVVLEGRTVRFASPREARAAGMSMVHQELAFCPDLTVAENLLLGQLPTQWRLIVDRREMVRRSTEMIENIAPELDPLLLMSTLSVAQVQLVQIAAAVGSGARTLIFDEPTSALSEHEAQRLFRLIRELRTRGVTLLYISHKMGEIFPLCDTITVLRDGKVVGALPTADATPDALVAMMIGRPMQEYFPHHLDVAPGEEVLRVENLSSPGKFRDISFAVRAGEVVGLAGLVGSGRSEVAQAVFGLDRGARGTVTACGTDVSRKRTRARMRAGIAYVPEDRKRQGLVPALSCRFNISLTILELLRRVISINRKRENAVLEKQFTSLAIKARSYETAVEQLSGGNQQKIVLAKWLARNARILILDEPTRGVDVGAKTAIHALIDDLARRGHALLLISSELPEVLNLSTRVLVMREGRIAGELTRGEATQERVMKLMSYWAHTGGG
jgi:ABC-type sugar transport system ATPase subunit